MTNEIWVEPRRKHSFRIGFLIHDVSRLRCTVIDKALRPFGVTRAQWWLLANLCRVSSSGIPQSDLARMLHIGKVTMGGLLDRLEENRFIERQPRPGDRRIHNILLTPRGRRLLAQIDKIGNAVSDEIMGGISKDEVLGAEAVLSKIKDRLIQMDAVPGRSNHSKVGNELGSALPSPFRPSVRQRPRARTRPNQETSFA